LKTKNIFNLTNKYERGDVDWDVGIELRFLTSLHCL